MEVNNGEVIAIMGPSGSGKSTLMNILGCLDKPTTGEYLLDGLKVSKMNSRELAFIRNQKVGFVFQNFNLLPRASALENVILPLRYNPSETGVLNKKAAEMLSTVGLAKRMHHRPYELSGGEQQRVAVARALVNNPTIILADEPTGNLDSKNGKEILDLLLSLNKERGVTLIIVTHDARIAKQTNRTIHIADGKAHR